MITNELLKRKLRIQVTRNTQEWSAEEGAQLTSAVKKHGKNPIVAALVRSDAISWPILQPAQEEGLLVDV
jgi:hypothetical protein